MNDENRKIAWSYITKIGDEMKGKLPESPNHPKGRNPYAHVALMVKNHFGMSYKDIEDEKMKEVIEYLNFLRENPE